MIKPATILLVCVSASACRNTSADEVADKLRSEVYAVDSIAGCIAKICTGMSEAQFLALQYPSSKRTVFLEGDEYLVMNALIEDAVSVEVLFDSGKVERLSTRSKRARDEHGNGVGSTLLDLKRTYTLEVLLRDQGGELVNFASGTTVVYQFNSGDFPSECIDVYKPDCQLNEQAEVVRIVVHSGPTRG